MAAIALVPLDGSALAEKSLPYIRLLSPLRPEVVNLVLVKEGASEKATRDELMAYLVQKADDLSRSSGVPAHPKLVDGIPFLAILEEAENDDVFLIATTTHGLSGNRSQRFGSVAARIINDAPCPTLIVGPDCQPPPAAFDRILVPLDGSPLAEIALPPASLLAERLGIPIELFRVVDPSSDEEGSQQANSSALPAEETADSYLKAVASKLTSNTEVDCVVRQGRPSDTLLGEFHRHPSAIVVMSSHGERGYHSYLEGSETSRVVPGPLPVLVIRPGQFTRWERLLRG